MKTSLLLASLLVPAWPLAAAGVTVQSEKVNHWWSCANVQLDSAKGVPDEAIHKYKFSGMCMVEYDPSGAKAQVWVDAEALWDVKTRTAEEALKMTGPATGLLVPKSVQGTYRCLDDPFIHWQAPNTCNDESFNADPGGASNSMVDDLRKWGPLMHLAHIDPKLAAQLSVAAKSAGAVPQPPMPKQATPPPPTRLGDQPAPVASIDPAQASLPPRERTAGRVRPGEEPGVRAAPSSTLARGLGAQAFDTPIWDGRRVDLCLVWGGQCGAPAATEFCKRSGYAKASVWKPATDIGAQTPTVVLSSGQVCSDASCDGFASITCSK